MSAENPQAMWGWQETILAQIYNLFSAYVFYQDKHNKHKKAPIIEIPKKPKQKKTMADTSQVDAILKKARKEV